MLRHAQASFGAARYDALSELGIEQAQRVGQFFKSRAQNFDEVWIGPRDRHRLSAQHALAPLGMDWRQPSEPALDEFAEGQQILASVTARRNLNLDGASRRDTARYYVEEIEAWSVGEAAMKGVRPASAFRADVGQWLKKAACGSGKSVLAVTSGGVISAVLCEVLNLPDRQLAQFMGSIYNSSMTELAFSEGRSPSLLSFNVASYLAVDMLTRI